MFKKTEKKLVRVRFAPSPTGPLHIGSARTALFNYLFAKKNKGKFILRIEDTDLQRSEQKWTDQIIEELKWLGINWDEGPDIGGDYGPYKQSQKLDIYEKYLKQLLKEDKAYYCFCSQEELEAKRQEQMSRGVAPKYDGKCSHLSKQEVEKNIAEGKPYVIRFKIKNEKVKIDDLIRGQVEFDAGLLGDIVIAKNLKAPLYHFTVVVDDFEMKISHIIRAEEHLANTPRQILIQEALGFERPIYAHVPLLLNKDRSKMSKRFGDVALADYHEKGYLPEAIINFVVLLGWNPGTEKEIFSLTQLQKEFSLEKVQKGGAVFNIERLDFINGLYIREKPIEKLTELCVPHLKKAGLLSAMQISENKLEKIIEVSRSRMKKLSEIIELTDFFFREKLNYDKDLLKWDNMTKEDIEEALLLCDKTLSEIKIWEKEKIEKSLLAKTGDFNKQKGYPENNKGFLLWPLRVALSGKKSSPSPFEIADILGKDETLNRIRSVANNQQQGFIKYIAIIAVIIIFVFLGQQAYVKGFGSDVILKASDAVNGSLAKGANWVTNEIFPKITGEVQKRGDMVKEEVILEKEKISENIGENLKNYFSGIVDSVFHPGNNSTGTQDCQPDQPNQTTP